MNLLPQLNGRVIDKLRKMFPGKWSYDHYQGIWVGPNFEVRAYSHLCPQYDGDDDTFRTGYHRTDTDEELFL